jgi:polar amino acid transport system substrate-binding protein
MGLSRRQFLSSTTLLGAAVAAGCSTTVVGEAKPNPADLRRIAQSSEAPPVPKLVTVAIIAFEPYTEGTGSDMKGPIPDVVRKVLADMGVEDTKFVIVSQQEQVLTGLKAGSFDIGGGLTLGPNCHGLKFSEPDLVSGTAFAVPAGNPKGIRTFADVAAQKAKVGVLTGAPEIQDAQAGGAGSIVQMPDPQVLLRAVRDGQVDCFAFDDISLHYMVKTIGQGVEATAPFMPAHRLPYLGAYAFPEDTTLLDAFNDKLKALHDSGEWLRMVTPFGFTEDNAPPADLTAEKACAG